MRKMCELGLVLLCTGLLLAQAASAQTSTVSSAAEAQAAQGNVAGQLQAASNAQATQNQKPDYEQKPQGPSEEELKLLEENQGKLPPPEDQLAVPTPILTFNPETTPGAGVRTSYPNTTPITIPSSGAATPYPSVITVSGEGEALSTITVTLFDMNHTYPDDLDILLVGPTGASVILMSDCGGGNDLVNVNLTFDDNAAASLPDSTQITSGTYKPTNIGTGDTFPAPAPAGPYGSALAPFLGTNPNGDWALYVVDDASGDLGNINGGWQLDITSSSTGACCVDFNCVATNTQAECDGLGGTWYGGQDCTTFICPPWNDDCTAVTPVLLTPYVPVQFTGDNLGSTNDCSLFPGGQVWHAITIPPDYALYKVTLDYCGTAPAFGNAWLNFATGCPCPGITAAGTFDTTTCGDDNVTIRWNGLAPGDYYYPVLLDPANGAAGPYVLNVVCEPGYCTSTATSTADETLQTVQIGTIDNTTTDCDTYNDFTYLSTDVVAGATYPFHIVIGDCEGTSCYNKRLAIWIDLNGDYAFADPGEKVYSSGQLGNSPCPDFPLDGLLTIPASATVGPTRMRIIVREGTTEPVPCGTYTWGATEDYTVNILPPPPGGACCFGTDCTPDMFQADCEAAGGRYKGDGTTCSPINPCSGACCFLDGSCLVTLDLAECAALSGNYAGDGTTCDPNLCPQPGNDCTNPINIVLSPDSLPLVDSDTTCGRVNDYSDTCLGSYDGGEDIIYAVTVTDPMCVTIAVDGVLTWVGVAIDTNCPPGATCLAYNTNSSGNPVIQSVDLVPGVYYIMIDTFPSPTCTDFTMTISACPTPAACCFSDGSCQMLLATECATAGGVFQGEGTTCDPNPCEVTYCTAGSSYLNCDEYISRVQVGTIDNATACSQPGGYGDYTALSTDLIYTVGVPITVTNGHPYSSDQCGIWIDWNHDLDFYGPGEQMTVSGTPGQGPYTATITAPPEALSGPTRMRIRITYTGVVDPCGITTYGEVEDYTVNVIEVPGACCWPDNTCTTVLPSECGGYYAGPFTACSGTDCNSNGVDDYCDIVSGYSTDCDSNGVPDECQPFEDCNSNGIADFCDLAECDGSPWCSDCNENGVLDECDILNGTSLDCQANGVPDECDLAGGSLVSSYDDGSSENALGNASYNHEICWIHHFTVAGPVKGVATTFGTPAYPGGSGVSGGDSFKIWVWSDPNGDGDPTDAVLLSETLATVDASAIDTDAFQTVLLASPVAVGPSYFVGASIAGVGFEAPMDEDEPLAHESWGAYTTTPPIDPNDMTAILFNADAAGFPCNWMLRVVTETTADCNNNGVPDACDVPPICEGPECSQDCNADLIPDECQLGCGDCNGNGRPDDCDIAAGTSQDCNGNGIPDECDIDASDPDCNGSVSQDCNADGVPDECQLDGNDCNSNGIPDDCDIATGNSCDCQPDGIPDECQLWVGSPRDLLQWDDGSSENSLGLTAGGEMCWMHHFSVAQPGTLQNIQTCFGTPLYPGGSGVSAGQPLRVYVWSDPNGDGNPMDAVFLGEATGVVSAGSIDTDVLQSVAIAATVDTSFFVGASVVTPASTYPGPMDENGPQYNEAWLTFNTVPFDPTNITANLYNMTDIGYPANWLLRAEVTFGAPPNDCNENGIPDECDIAVQFGGKCVDLGAPCYPSECDSDWNSNGIPDGCELCGDLDGDGDVDVDDYWVFADSFGACVGSPKYNAEADMDGDGCVTLVDYQAWRMCYKMANGTDFVAPKPKPLPTPRPTKNGAAR
jgi:subtilisin-like proprotein convertase family protein